MLVTAVCCLYEKIFNGAMKNNVHVYRKSHYIETDGKRILECQMIACKYHDEK